MKQNIDWGSWISNIIALFFCGFILFFFINVGKIIYVKTVGIPQTIEVSYHGEINLKYGYKISSFGYYYVNGHRYIAHSDSKIPIGATFEIKYNPHNPRDWERVKTDVKNKK